MPFAGSSPRGSQVAMLAKPPQLPCRASRNSEPSSEVSSSQSEVEGEEQQTDQKRRRSRAHRPYSFQQRMKERDKQ